MTVPQRRDFRLLWRPDPTHRSGSFRSIRVRWTRGNRRSAPDRLWPRTGVAHVSCHSGTKGAVDPRPLPMAPLCLGSPWRSATERLGASSLGFDMARCRHDPSRTGRGAHRLGLASRTHRTRLPSIWTEGSLNLRPPRFLAGTCEILGRGRPPPGGDRTAPGAVQRRLWAFETAAQLLSIMKPRMNAEEAFQEVAAKAEELIDWSHGGRQTRLETMPYKEYLATPEWKRSVEPRTGSWGIRPGSGRRSTR